MKIRLNRAPYICPVIEDNLGEKDGHYLFREDWLGQVHDVELISNDNDMFMTVKIPTWVGQDRGWLLCQVVKECFDVIEEAK
jgi:hypothetical protein